MKRETGPKVLPEDQHNQALVSNVSPPRWRNPEPSGRYNLVVIGGGPIGSELSQAFQRLGEMKVCPSCGLSIVPDSRRMNWMERLCLETCFSIHSQCDHEPASFRLGGRHEHDGHEGQSQSQRHHAFDQGQLGHPCQGTQARLGIHGLVRQHGAQEERGRGAGSMPYMFKTDAKGEGTYSASLSESPFGKWQMVMVMRHPDGDPGNMKNMAEALSAKVPKAK